MAMTSIYIDGVYFKHILDSKAGIGVYFNNNDPKNASEQVVIDFDDGMFSSFTAKLIAIKTVLLVIRDEPEEDITIMTDSKKVIEVLNQVISDMESTTHKRDILLSTPENNLVDYIGELAIERIGCIRFGYVKPHSGNHGNNQAHRLAVEGAKK